MKIESAKINIANQHLEDMAKKAMSIPNYPPDQFYSAVKRRVFEYQCINQLDVAGERLSQLAKKFFEMGRMDFAGIICSLVSKLQQLPFEAREQYIIQAINIAEQQNDKIHVVARLEDLCKAYVERGDISKLLKVLIKKENALKEVIADFDTAKKNFRTLVYKNENIENYEDILATTQVDIAKIIMRKKPKKAVQKLQKAIEYFEKIGDTERSDFANDMLKRATYYRESIKKSKQNRG